MIKNLNNCGDRSKTTMAQLEEQKKMINNLAKSSIDCVKFQLGNPEKIFSKDL